MNDIYYMMPGFYKELTKQAGVASEVGETVLKGVMHPVNALRGATGVAKSTFQDMGGAIGRSGQRQLHALTGWTPKGWHNPEGIRDMRAGAHEAVEQFHNADNALKPGHVPEVGIMDKLLGREPGSPGITDKLLGRSAADVQARAHAGRVKELEAATKHRAVAEKAEGMGLTSIPGYLKSFARAPMDTVRTGLQEQWHGLGTGGKALMAGVPAVGVASELAHKSEPGEKGRLARAGERVGDLAYTMAPLPFAGQMAAGMGVGAAGKAIGGLMDRMTSRKKNPTQHIPAPPTLEPAGGEAVPGERVITDRALNTGGF